MHEETIAAWNEGKDILYRTRRNDGKWTGWRSFRKACKKGNPPWPWDYPVSSEWMVKE